MSAGRSRPPRDEGDDRPRRDEPATGTERFADLLGDARPLPSRPSPTRPAKPPHGAIDARGVRARGRPLRAGEAAPAAFRWPDPDDRHRAAAPGIDHALLLRLGRGEIEPEERVDLHGTRIEAAKRLLAQRLASALARGLRCVLVVHGRGRRSATDDAPLRDAVPDWLSRGENARRVLAFTPAPLRFGGDGATLVLLRKHAAGA